MNNPGSQRYDEAARSAVRHLDRAAVWQPDTPTADHLKAAGIEATLAHAEALRLLAEAMAPQPGRRPIERGGVRPRPSGLPE
ncbi:hypothetical protein [Streptomyces sp. NPDC097610]|uniref:hypothetical protein n=1 Tax=Streptomyces sp. NPDC097610 TaxID=3157227 RepID=UPI0033254A99